MKDTGGSCEQDSAGQREEDGIETIISAVLWAGVTGSLVLLALGSMLSFAQAGGYGSTPADVERLIRSDASFPRTLTWFFQSLGRLEGKGIIAAGLLMLIATPIIRVAISIGFFAVQKDRIFVLVTTGVLALLLLSFVLGKAG